MRSRVLILLLLPSLLVVTCVAVGGCGTMIPSTSTGPIVQGAVLFEEYCSTCHGLHAEGGVGPNLRTLPKNRTVIDAQVKNGRGPMAGFTNTLTPEQINTVVDYVMNLTP
jgi:mono/diheme cytochrome c family protein